MRGGHSDFFELITQALDNGLWPIVLFPHLLTLAALALATAFLVLAIRARRA